MLRGKCGEDVISEGDHSSLLRFEVFDNERSMLSRKKKNSQQGSPPIEKTAGSACSPASPF